MSELEPYEVFGIKYCHAPRQAFENFILSEDHDTSPMPLDYFVWAIKGPKETFVFDTGMEPEIARKRNRNVIRTPSEGLQLVGVNSGEVKNVIISHMHYDHSGNYDAFPNAHYHIQDREIAYCTGRCMCFDAMRIPFEVDDVTAMVRKVFDKRVHFHDGVGHVAPGITVHHVGGHSRGLQIMRVWTRRGWLVLASDASHFYANFEQNRPHPIVDSQPDALEGYATMRRLADGPNNIIPGHDPLILKRYPAPSKDLEGIVARVDADPIGV